MKANWGRTKKEEGIKAMNTVVTPKKNPIVSVDPFGPPIIANPAGSPTKSPQQPKKRLALPPPDKEKKEIKREKEAEKPKESREKSPHRSILKKDEQGDETGGESGKENDRISRRPKSSGRVRSPKRSKTKSKSPKQVSISTELPTKKDLVESDIGNNSNGITHANGFSFSTLLDQKTDDEEIIEENYGADDFDDEDINDLI